MEKQVSGVIVPIITPFSEENEIDFKSFEKQVRFLVEKGINGVVVCGTTGEGHLLSLNEKKSLIEFICDLRRNMEKDFIVISGTATTNIKEAKEIVEFSEKCDCDAILALCPKEEKLKFFKDLKALISLPIIVYYIPKLESTISPEELSQLVDSNIVIGIKDSSQDYGLLKKWKKVNVDTFVAVGEDTFITQSIKEGLADAAIPGTGNVAPEECINAYIGGMEQKDDFAQKQLNNVIKGLLKTGSFVGALKEIQAGKGIIFYKNRRN